MFTKIINKWHTPPQELLGIPIYFIIIVVKEVYYMFLWNIVIGGLTEFIIDFFNDVLLSYNYYNVRLHAYTLVEAESLYIMWGFYLSFQFALLQCISYLNIFFELQMSTNMQDAINVSIKFLLCIALLIFARGGIPRFRFDYLTKLGWIRFLSLVILSFVIELIILSMF